MSMSKTYPNGLTARTTLGCKIPIIMDNDFDTIRAGIKTAPDADYENLRIVRIKTLRLDEMEISEALRKLRLWNTFRRWATWRFSADGILSAGDDQRMSRHFPTTHHCQWRSKLRADALVEAESQVIPYEAVRRLISCDGSCIRVGGLNSLGPRRSYLRGAGRFSIAQALDEIFGERIG